MTARAMVRVTVPEPSAPSIEAFIAEHGPQRVIDVVRPYLTPSRKQRIDEVVECRLRGVQVAVEQPSDPHNAAAVVRTAEAMGVLGVHAISAEGRALHARRTTQGSFHWVETQHHDTWEAFLSTIRQQDVLLCGAWMDADVSIDALEVDRPLCLLFGNESRGLSARARAACDVGFSIPMSGMSESLNLSVSAAIALYEVCKRRRAHVGPSDLDEANKLELRARYYARTVSERLLEGLLRRAHGHEATP